MKIWITALLVFAPLAHAQDLALDQALTNFLGDSAQVRGQTDLSELADGDRWRRYLPNEPKAKYLNDENNSKRVYGFDIDVSFPGRSFAISKLDSANARAAHREINAKRVELANTFAQAYLQCASAEAIYEVRETALADIETFAQSLKSRRGVTQAEKIGSELEARQARRELAESKDEKDVNCKKLTSLLAQSSGGASGNLPSLSLPDDLNDGVMRSLGGETPDQSRAISTIEIADATISTAWWSQMPNLTLTAERHHLLDQNRWADTYGVAMTLPLLFPFAESVEARRARSQAVIDRDASNLKRIQANAEQMEAGRTYRRSRSHLKELRQRDLPLARALVESSYSAYRSGQLGYAEMVLSRRTWVDLRVKDVELRNAVVNSRLTCLQLCESPTMEAR